MSNYQAENIGRIIAAKRREAGMTQEMLASCLQITPQAVSKWENGVGLPDLTLIPQIASALEISPNELFGVSDRKEDVPQVYMGMQLVCTDGSAAVYSNKSVCKEQDGVVSFSDGSEANLNSGVVINCGAGEARIFSLQDIAPEILAGGYEHDSLTQTFEGVDSLELINSASCEISVVRGEDEMTVLEADGSKRFISRLDIAKEGGLLRVNAQQCNNNHGTENGNRLTLKVGFDAGELLKLTISGCGDAKIEPSFGKAELKISGSGSINVTDLGVCSVAISGSGNVATEDVKESLDVRISGSGDVACADVRAVTVRIAGSGDLAVMNLYGSLDAAISGSGDIACAGGEVDTLRIAVNGSGELTAKWLTVGDAEISLQGSGSVAIGRIKGKSVERLSKNSTLTVGTRG